MFLLFLLSLVLRLFLIKIYITNRNPTVRMKAKTFLWCVLAAFFLFRTSRYKWKMRLVLGIPSMTNTRKERNKWTALVGHRVSIYCITRLIFFFARGIWKQSSQVTEAMIFMTPKNFSLSLSCVSRRKFFLSF